MGASLLALTKRSPIARYESEGDLLAGCRRREIRAFEELYRTNSARLKSIAYHTAGNRQDAEDAVQETFLKAYRGIDGFAGGASIGTWLCRICINACYDLIRRRQRAAEHAGEEQPHQPQPQFTLRAQLNQALSRIDARRRMVFLLFAVEGMKHAEIAAILEIPEGTSKAWLFEAKRELQRLLTEPTP
ncbi:MAG TPA: RNA polymerase sigma factor [Bryobacteraceae bacterium]|jgi:RNA polymerase sigma-70 factor (ECF subfamily)|nr:RNA polymerase sigma factor [Bryobacteraceae bacterium]